MTFEIEINKKLVSVKLENKNRIKHCYIRILKDDYIEIRANRYFTIYDAKELIERKKDWISSTISKLKKVELASDEFLYLGQIKKFGDYKIKNIDTYYKKKIEEILPLRVEEFAKEMNLFPSSISFRKNKRTWGSCNFQNHLTFNILLMKYPIEVMDYVIVHELAHIKHKNHSKDFWNLVGQYCPDYKKIEKMFKNF